MSSPRGIKNCVKSKLIPDNIPKEYYLLSYQKKTKKPLLLLSASVNLCPPDSWREYQEKSYIQSPVSLVKNLPEAN